ncbi:IclR family transcriptional regulator [Actinopolymorpha pittospori]|uniref:DNA-binding IclR family transcriptional regulator n=1 Tax=Actinopolymorpha pittospori TaxID=648752 RepID=A0A927MPC2_9ACTN|nr:IclR family transcriptional regulator [Actinopolymorpha pittospori]MBE1603697.1 DNA-binding IclR family transcriptional regulator [Actinopolymorpha pittospori]
MSDSAIRNDNSRSTVLRAFSILEVFTAADDQISLGELAERSGNPKSSTHRIVTDLVMAGALERGDSGYRLGVRMFELGHLVPLQRKLREVALPFLQDLHEVTHLATTLAVRDGTETVYVEKLVSHDTNAPYSRVGSRMPLHCTALGKAILAFTDPESLEELLAGGLRPITDRTVLDPEQLRRELAAIRRSRIAYDSGESRRGRFCVAAPVFAGTTLVGALSVSGHAGAERTQRLGPAVMGTARALSRSLGPSMPMRTG